MWSPKSSIQLESSVSDSLRVFSTCLLLDSLQCLDSIDDVPQPHLFHLKKRTTNGRLLSETLLETKILGYASRALHSPSNNLTVPELVSRA